jgi:AAA family ATP:ADP antiporter
MLGKESLVLQKTKSSGASLLAGRSSNRVVSRNVAKRSARPQGVVERSGASSLVSRKQVQNVFASKSSQWALYASPKNAIVKAAAEEPEEKKFLGMSMISLGKFCSLAFMFFCILFNYTILRDTKDVLVVTAPGSGAEIIPFLKTWLNLPLAFAFMWVYSKMSNFMSPQRMFYTIIFPFLAFFTSFAFILYPLKDVIHPYAAVDNLLQIVGPRFAAPLAIVSNWSFCLFYVASELWGSVVVSVLFWGFANQICTVDEAKQFYPLFGLGANVALIFSGRAVKYFSQVRANLPPGVDGWAVSLKGMMSLVLVFGCLIALNYFLVNKFLLPRAKLPTSAAPKKKKSKENMSVPESLKFLAGQRYIRDLATLVVAYGISINLVEVTWKSKIKAQFPNPNDYSSFMGDFSTYTGVVTFIMMLASRFIFKKFGWGVAALITPVVLFITAIGFFGLVLFSEALTPSIAAMGMTPLFAAVLIGAAQNIFSKSSKYSLFDPCKEMAYIPLDQETKIKGKAAIDVVCNPLGKSGGALIQQFLILGFGSLAASTPYLAVCLFFIIGIWIRSSMSLNEQFTEVTKEDIKAEMKASDSEVKVQSKVGEGGTIEGEVVAKDDK